MTAAARRLGAQTGMELRLLLRNGENLLVAFGIPLIVLVFFSLVDVLPTDGMPGVDFLLPGVLALSIMSTAMVSLGIATGFERHYLVLKRLGATPLRRRELVAAKVAAVLAVETVQVAAVVVIGAVLLGWRPPPEANAAVALLALGLGTAAFAGLGLTMAGRLRAVGTLAAANLVYLGLLLISGIAFPLDRLPDAVAGIAGLLPAAPLANLLRAGAGSTQLAGGDLVVLTAWAAGAVAVAAATFRWE